MYTAKAKTYFKQFTNIEMPDVITHLQICTTRFKDIKVKISYSYI